MRKNLLLAMMLFAGISVVNAQQKNFSVTAAKPFAGISRHTAPGVNGACDTLNLDDAMNVWSALLYSLGGNGYVFGTSNLSSNGYTVQEDANYFDASSSDYNYISGGLAYFAIANSNVAANLDKDVIFKVYDDAGGVPGSVLGSFTLKLSQIHQDVLDGNLTEFLFSTPIAIPASKTFYISIDHSAFKWNETTHDSIAIVANADDETVNAAYQYIKITASGTQWLAVNQFWHDNAGHPLDVNLFIFPYMSNALDGCTALPVNIFNFTGSIKNNQAYLTWSTATETNNKGFEIERSNDGKNFTGIAFVNGAGNSSQIKNYVYTDAGLKDFGASTTYYRLKQVDMDGKANYSNVLPLSMDVVQSLKLFPNPVKDKITLQFSLASTSKSSLQVISRDGKIVMNVDKGILSEGSQLISLDVKKLAGGSYLVRLTAGDKAYTQSFIKE